MALQEKETLTFPLALLPQRAGHLLYPTVELHVLFDGSNHRSTANEREASSTQQGPPLHCQTDYRNQADVILVLPSLKSTTVNIDIGASAGTARLVDSEQRDEGVVS